MPRKLIIVNFCLLSLFRLAAQSDASQVMMPVRVYVGDTAELRCTFHSDVDFFSDADDSAVSIPLDAQTIRYDADASMSADDFTIVGAALEKSTGQSGEYVFVLRFIPWRTGELRFPRFTVAAGDASAFPFTLALQSVTVSSVLQNPGEAELRPAAGPLLLPGTMYALYALAVVALVILLLLINLLRKWRRVRDALKQRKLLRAYAKNARNFYRSLRRLEKSGAKIDDRIFCAELQKTVRRYLHFRFGERFVTTPTSALMELFDEETAGLMSARKQDGATSLAAVMRRADYVRYAHGSLDAEREPQEQYAAALQKDERGVLINMARDSVVRFEAKEG